MSSITKVNAIIAKAAATWSMWPERIATQTELHLSVVSSFAFDSKGQQLQNC